MIPRLFSVRNIKELDLEFFWDVCDLNREEPHHNNCYNEVVLGKKQRTVSVFTVLGGKNPKLRGLGGRGGANE